MSNDKDANASKKPWYEKLHFGLGIICGILSAVVYMFTIKDRIKNSDQQITQNPTSSSISHKDKEIISTEPPSKSTQESMIDENKDVSKKPIYEESGNLSLDDSEIRLSENHIPNDPETNVEISEWDPNSDIGINGNTYNGGNKVKISSAFYALGSSIENKIKSRITVPISDKTKQYCENNRFVGAFVLDKNMIGKNSSGTIEIIIKNKKVFSTGEIDGNIIKAFPFDVNYGDANSIIIEANVTLNGSDFIYSFVNTK